MDFRNIQTLGWMIFGLVFHKSVSLAEWSSTVKSKAQVAASSERRFSRWLHNSAINPREFYSPVVREMLAGWDSKKPLYLALDTCMLWDRYCCIRLSLIYMNRAVPVTWHVLEHDSASISFKDYRPVLEAARDLLPRDCRVVLLADRGFCHWNFMAWLHEIGWHWRIRAKKNLSFRTKGRKRAVKITFKRGRAQIWKKIQVNSDEVFPLSLAAGLPVRKDAEAWIVLSNEPLMSEIFQDYARRFCIDEGFLDEKSGGYKLEESQIRDAETLNRLILVMALTTVCLVNQGMDIMEAEERRKVDTHWKRGISYFKIGWRWILKVLSGALENTETRLIQNFCLPCIEDPEPAIASEKKAKRQTERNHICYRFPKVTFAR